MYRISFWHITQITHSSSSSLFDSVVASNKIQSNLYYANEHIITEGETYRAVAMHSFTQQ